MKRSIFKLMNLINKTFKLWYCVLYTRNFDYTKWKDIKWWNNWFKNKEDCPFCKKENLVEERNYSYIINNANPYPNTEKHILITPKRHIRSWKELTKEELNEFQILINKYLEQDYIVLWRQYKWKNSKSWASVYHLHIHLILRK